MSEIVSEKAIVLSSADILSNYQIEQNKNIVVGNNCVQNGEKPYIEWYYDQSGFYWYVLINGDIDLKDYVVKRLEEHNIKSIRTGKSYKIAGNGKKYDWFLRVLYIPNNSVGIAVIPPTRDQVHEVFSKYFTLYKDKYSELEYRYNEIECQLAISLDENTKLNNKIRKLKNDLYYKEIRLSSFINRYKMLEDDSTTNMRVQIFENHKLQNDIKVLNEQIFILKNFLDENNDFEDKIKQQDKMIKYREEEIAEWEKENDELGRNVQI
jgi:hypothetical protein